MALTQIAEERGKEGTREGGDLRKQEGGRRGHLIVLAHSKTQIVQEPECLIVRDCLIVLAHPITQIVQVPESLIARDCWIVLAHPMTQIVQKPESLIVRHSGAREFDST